MSAAPDSGRIADCHEGSLLATLATNSGIGPASDLNVEMPEWAELATQAQRSGLNCALVMAGVGVTTS